MKPLIAIVESAVDVQQIACDIHREHIALQDDERNADAHEKRTIGYRESAARRRVEIGRLLVEAKRGIKRGNWEPYLEKLGITSQRASEWMRLAGFVESQSPSLPNVGDSVPTLADASIDKRPRKSAQRDEQPDPPTEDTETEHIESEFVPVFKRVEKTIVKEAMQMFPKDRQLFAAWLRSVANEIDPTRQGDR